MAKAADAATPAPDDDADMGATDTGDQSADAGQSDWQTIATIQCKTDSGEYRLIQGDEPEAGEAAPDTGDESSQGQTYDSVGPLLKGVLDLVKAHEASGPGGAEDNFAQGYAGGAGASATPAAPAMAQKY